jgi:hypothetical protein
MNARRAFLPYILIGAMIGLIVGTAFVVIWFGTSGGFFHFMALIHELSGAALGIIIALVVRSLRR